MSAGPEARLAAPKSRPPLRVLSCQDIGLGLRFLSADGVIFSRWGVWARPVAVGAVDASGDPLRWLDDAALEPLFQWLGERDSRPETRWLRTAFLPSATVVDRVAEYVQAVTPTGYVLDAELFDSDGRPRVGSAALEAFRRKLVPNCSVLAANRHEAAALAGRPVEGLETMRDTCRALWDQGAKAVLLTGGHLEPFPRDLLYDGHGFDELGADRVAISGAVRGAGGILSAVLTAGLVRGLTLTAAAEQARNAVTLALEARLRIGREGLLRVDEVPADEAAGGLWIANASRVPPPA